MKKTLPALLLAACMCLAGCAAPVPVTAADGTAWDSSWITVGGIIGVDTPEGIEPRENNEALSVQGMYYATWSIGEPEPYVNEDGDDSQIYDAQIYLLLAGYNASEKAEDSVAEWQAMAGGRYAVEETLPVTCSGQDYTVLFYEFDSETNPYSRGASAFGVYRNYAVSIELSCREGFDGDPLEVLTGFLEHCHYSA